MVKIRIAQFVLADSRTCQYWADAIAY